MLIARMRQFSARVEFSLCALRRSAREIENSVIEIKKDYNESSEIFSLKDGILEIFITVAKTITTSDALDPVFLRVCHA